MVSALRSSSHTSKFRNSGTPETNSVLCNLRMAKEKPTDPEKEARKLANAEKKAKRSETDGVHKSKSDKKDKKEKKSADTEVTAKLLEVVEGKRPGSVAIKEEVDVKAVMKSAPLLGALVPFANPLADEKVGKKVLKSVKKGKPLSHISSNNGNC